MRKIMGAVKQEVKLRNFSKNEGGGQNYVFSRTLWALNFKPAFKLEFLLPTHQQTQFAHNLWLLTISYLIRNKSKRFSVRLQF